jgi:glycosyltransferase involved in cell wall biosynthesis
MTGTDLYRDLPLHPEVTKSMEMANAIVVLQAAALASIPKAHHSKTHIIYQSIQPIQRQLLSKRSFLVSVIGHLRPEKDPFCTAKALALLPSSSTVQVTHLGKAMSEDMERQASSYADATPRYEWLGELSHQETLDHLSRSHLMVISSVMEGGAHVVSEAISALVPVIASDIPGNRGLLGDDYPGYYPVGNEAELAKLLLRSERDPEFYQALELGIKARQKYVMPEFEQGSLQKLVQALLP